MSVRRGLVVFTSEACTLCGPTKHVAARAARRSGVSYSEVDIKAPGNEHWNEKYALAIPVVHFEGEPVWKPSLAENIASESGLLRIIAERVDRGTAN
jgi:hypothetical protein